MAKINLQHDGCVALFFCPGCKNTHWFFIKPPALDSHWFDLFERNQRPVWNFNGSLDSPTVLPSLLYNKDYPDSRCHSFVENGSIKFLSDCYHVLKNQTVEIPEYEV